MFEYLKSWIPGMIQPVGKTSSSSSSSENVEYQKTKQAGLAGKGKDKDYSSESKEKGLGQYTVDVKKPEGTLPTKKLEEIVSARNLVNGIQPLGVIGVQERKSILDQMNAISLLAENIELLNDPTLTPTDRKNLLETIGDGSYLDEKIEITIKNAYECGLQLSSQKNEKEVVQRFDSFIKKQEQYPKIIEKAAQSLDKAPISLEKLEAIAAARQDINSDRPLMLNTIKKRMDSILILNDTIELLKDPFIPTWEKDKLLKAIGNAHTKIEGKIHETIAFIMESVSSGPVQSTHETQVFGGPNISSIADNDFDTKSERLSTLANQEIPYEQIINDAKGLVLSAPLPFEKLQEIAASRKRLEQSKSLTFNDNKIFNTQMNDLGIIGEAIELLEHPGLSESDKMMILNALGNTESLMKKIQTKITEAWDLAHENNLVQTPHFALGVSSLNAMTENAARYAEILAEASTEASQSQYKHNHALIKQLCAKRGWLQSQVKSGEATELINKNKRLISEWVAMIKKEIPLREDNLENLEFLVETHDLISALTTKYQHLSVEDEKFRESLRDEVRIPIEKKISNIIKNVKDAKIYVESNEIITDENIEKYASNLVLLQEAIKLNDSSKLTRLSLSDIDKTLDEKIAEALTYLEEMNQWTMAEDELMSKLRLIRIERSPDSILSTLTQRTSTLSSNIYSYIQEYEKIERSNLDQKTKENSWNNLWIQYNPIFSRAFHELDRLVIKIEEKVQTDEKLDELEGLQGIINYFLTIRTFCFEENQATNRFMLLNASTLSKKLNSLGY